MKKSLVIISILVVALLVVGLGFVSAEENNIQRGRFLQRENRPMMGMMGGQRSNMEDILENEEILERIAEHKGISVEELKEFVEENQERFESKGSRIRMGRHMGRANGQMGNGDMINRILEDEELLEKFANNKGITAEELREWLEACPFR